MDLGGTRYRVGVTVSFVVRVRDTRLVSSSSRPRRVICDGLYVDVVCLSVVFGVFLTSTFTLTLTLALTLLPALTLTLMTLAPVLPRGLAAKARNDWSSLLRNDPSRCNLYIKGLQPIRVKG